ncbi:MAG: hypothetical protein G8237_14575 [Magnetococcales bacterium]|nr:hypothetical protein [Magnetococcales bacterium]
MNAPARGMWGWMAGLVVVCVWLAGCSKSEEKKAPAVEKSTLVTQSHAPATGAAPGAVVPTPPARLPQTGKILEGRQGGPYTFIQVEADGERYWLATNPFKPKPGEQVHWEQATVRQNYRSTALNHTFPMILFVDRIRSGSPPVALPPGKGKAHVVLQSGGYTYIQVGGPTGNWLAVPTSRVKEGDGVAWSQGTVMKNFTSKSLGRTFEEIRFLDKIKVDSVSSIKSSEEQTNKQSRQLQRAVPNQESRDPALRRGEVHRPVQKPTSDRSHSPPQKPVPAKVPSERQRPGQ